MAKAVFTSKIESGYDDDIETRYHFPRKYLRAAEQTVGDLILYYQPRRGGNQTYFGVAEVMGIREDASRENHYYADLRNFLSFEREVPYAENGDYYESQLQKQDGTANRGSFEWSVRILPEYEFQAILNAGFDEPAERPSQDLSAAVDFQFSENEQTPFEGERPRVSFTRPFRDRAFTKIIQKAYDRRCAVTGLRLINGGGRPEVQAAHIVPVSKDGPDSVRNGIALSGTIHWLFDRGLMTVENDLQIKLVDQAIPPEIRSLINPTGRLIVPESPHAQPSPNFLRFHRESIFKG